MKYLNFALTTILLSWFSTELAAQLNAPSSITNKGHGTTCTITSGSVLLIENATDIAIEYSYDELRVGMNMKETDFLNKMALEVNKEKPGEGDRIKIEWESYKVQNYEPVFETVFNAKAEELGLGIKGTNYAKDKKYTLVVNVITIAPGPILSKMATCFFDSEFIFKDSLGVVLCKFYVKNVQADRRRFGPDVNHRIASCYHEAAIYLVERMVTEKRRAEKKRKG